MASRTEAVEPVYKVNKQTDGWEYELKLGEFKNADTRYGSGVLGIDMPLKGDPGQILFNFGGRSKTINLTTEKIAEEADMNNFLTKLENAQDRSISSGDGILTGMPYDIQNLEPGDKNQVVIGDWEFTVTNKDIGGKEVIELSLEILYGELIGLFTIGE